MKRSYSKIVFSAMLMFCFIAVTNTSLFAQADSSKNKMHMGKMMKDSTNHKMMMDKKEKIHDKMMDKEGKMHDKMMDKKEKMDKKMMDKEGKMHDKMMDKKEMMHDKMMDKKEMMDHKMMKDSSGKMMDHKGMMEHKDMMMDKKEMGEKMESMMIRKGDIDLKAIDENKDGKVYQDMMDWNVISDKPGVCPECGMTLKEVPLEKAKENLIKHNYKVK